MRIHRAYLTAGARDAIGVAIVIDVFRACSVMAHVLAAGARRVIPVAGVDEARELKREQPDWLLIGERHARRLPGFDAGNSPTEVLELPLGGATLIHTTHAGTQGLTAADNRHLFTGAFVNHAATVRAVWALAPDDVTIVAMGHQARERCLEDDLCADLFEARLSGQEMDTRDLAVQLRRAPAAAKFFDPAADWAPEADFACCTALDSIDIAVRRRRDPTLQDRWVLERA